MLKVWKILLRVLFFFSLRRPTIRSAHERKKEKELDLQQNSLISGCTCSTICVSFLRVFILFPEEKKSVISNFLIVIVFVLYCVPLWFFYDLFMTFMLFSFFSLLGPAHLAQGDHYYTF